ncbi:MAG: ABC transporter permease [Alphaproteobacteria bacterium]|nr:ABC transporter permease [Alphaproteobacteria bacterium]
MAAEPSFALAQALTGLASASSLFLVAAGLSIVFGVTRVVNFAHGSFFMVGAYLAVTAIGWLGGGAAGFWGGVVVAVLGVGLLGVLVEVAILRRLYAAPELFQLLATFGVVLVIQDGALFLWGPEDLLGPRAPGLRGAVEIFGQRIPTYDLFLIAVGPVVLVLLWLAFRRTRWGVLVRAATADREMTAALGVDERRLFTGVFALGALLAGLGGALQVPRETANLHMDLNVIAEAFVVVVVGGMGSVVGAYLAALVIGVVHAFGILLFPKLTLVLVFLIMAVVLVIRPAGLLGERGAASRQGAPEAPLRPASARLRWTAAALFAALLALPAVAGGYVLVLAVDVAILALFAASLHLLLGPGGMISFGHAAYFGIGAYGAGLAWKWLAAPMVLGLAVAPLAAGIAGAAFGWLCARASGVYLAMLTLAYAQIAWSVAAQWLAVTGGDNGVLGLWPAPWAASPAAYYYLSLVLCGGGILALRLLVHAPFGQFLRAGRDAPRRAEALGVAVGAQQWLAFIVAGAFAGLAGGLFAYAKGSVFPTYLAIPRSVDGLVMVLLGGVQSLSGPVVGALAYVGLADELARGVALWRLVLGAAIIVLAVAFRRGLAGAVGDAAARP